MTNAHENDIAYVIADIVERIRPILAGHPSAIQGTILADCLATWLAGHLIPGDAEATRKLRDDLLATHLETVAELVPLHARMIGTEPGASN